MYQFSILFVIVIIVHGFLHKPQSKPKETIEKPLAKPQQSIIKPIESKSLPKRLVLPQGPDKTFPSNISTFVLDGERFLLVRYIFYKYDRDTEAMVLNKLNHNHTGLFRVT
jgi:hypothetical protein